MYGFEINMSGDQAINRTCCLAKNQAEETIGSKNESLNDYKIRPLIFSSINSMLFLKDDSY